MPGEISQARLMNLPSSWIRERSYKATRLVGSLPVAAARTERPITTGPPPLRRVSATIGAAGRAAPGGVIGNGRCQFPPSRLGLAHVVAPAPSGPIQNTSHAPPSRVT